ncbi:acetylornithine deacetylase or succinyl- diaminopimelate desuccinylase [Rhodopirellula maiorica SM1]|uniref:Probable succinyl-diaminopimelate desuccinylase n=1 Tax=Rhodopirellula maiorica SM1 TaxID=1265738 RepID=M5RBG7_9BACT|nr:acetylornithine deacetylase or succinyl- diaminopimelate desuccinylase [Rhodopirellula maiorica SM1]
MLDTLADLVRINSVNPNYEAGVPEAEIADFVEQFFATRGIETWRQLVYPDRPNVIARVPGRDPQRRIVLEAHMDTVSTIGMTIDPWTPEIRDGKMYGRGACDTKGGMAAMMHAVAQLAADEITPECDVLFAATIDEEFSYRGVVALCNSLDPGDVDPRILSHETSPQNPWTAEAAIVAEPTDLKAVIASKGLVRWKIETRGKAAHSAKPHLGVNAIEHMAHVITAIQQDTLRLSQQKHPLLGPATCNIGVIRGGVQINFVPDRCEIEIDRRLLPGETRETVLEHYQQLVDSVADEHPSMDVVMHPPMLSDRPLETDADSPAVKTMANVLREMGMDADLIGVPFCSDASKFGAIGIPSMILGPGSIDQAHAAVEYIECSQVIQAAEIYRRFLVEFV